MVEAAKPKEEIVLTTLGAHSFFGEMALLNPYGKATASVRVITYFEGYMLQIGNYQHLILSHPDLKNFLEAAAKLRLRQRNDLKGEGDSDLSTLFAMLDPTKRKLIKLERETREKAAFVCTGRTSAERSGSSKSCKRVGLSESSSAGGSRSETTGTGTSWWAERKTQFMGAHITLGRNSTSPSSRRATSKTAVPRADAQLPGMSTSQSTEMFHA